MVREADRKSRLLARLGVSQSTFSEYKKTYPELLEAIKKGKTILVYELRSALIKRAKGYSYIETKTVTEKVKWPSEIYEKLLDAGHFPKVKLKKAVW